MSTLKSFSELTPDQQDQLRETYREYAVLIDPMSFNRYIRFMGEDVDLDSVQNAQVLLG